MSSYYYELIFKIYFSHNSFLCYFFTLLILSQFTQKCTIPTSQKSVFDRPINFYLGAFDADYGNVQILKCAAAVSLLLQSYNIYIEPNPKVPLNFKDN